ncbi:MAG: type II secretion system major pseudopilin GspG [bacterium]
MNKSKKEREKGFTLIEVLVVVFILAILAAIVGPKVLGRTDDAKIAEAKLQIKNLETALKLYKLDNGFYPTTEQGLQALVSQPTSEPIPKKYKEGGYLEKKKIPKDPWGNDFIYLCPGAHGDFDISSYGADGKPGGEGKDADINSWEIE